MAEYWHVGDWAFGYFEGDEYWYPVEITDINDDELTIRYDYDDSEETVSADYLVDYATEEGEEGAECWWDEDGVYYAVNVKEVADDDQVLVEFEDGSAAWVDLSNLRFAGQ